METPPSIPPSTPAFRETSSAAQSLDLSGLHCPQPLLRLKKALIQLQSGQLLDVKTTDSATPDDFARFCQHTGHEILVQWTENGAYRFTIRCR